MIFESIGEVKVMLDMIDMPRGDTKQKLFNAEFIHKVLNLGRVPVIWGYAESHKIREVRRRGAF
jgi:hypothetical protein